MLKNKKDIRTFNNIAIKNGQIIDITIILKLRVT